MTEHPSMIVEAETALAAIRLFNATKAPPPATRYLLPDWLGGHEVTLITENYGDTKAAAVAVKEPDGKTWAHLTVPRKLLTVIEPSDEPPAGTVIQDGNGRIWFRGEPAHDRYEDLTRFDGRPKIGTWFSVSVHMGDVSTWKVLRGLGPIVELIPKPVNLIAAVQAWVDRITDDPREWADEHDFALITAVKELGPEGKSHE